MKRILAAALALVLLLASLSGCRPSPGPLSGADLFAGNPIRAVTFSSGPEGVRYAFSGGDAETVLAFFSRMVFAPDSGVSNGETGADWLVTVDYEDGGADSFTISQDCARLSKNDVAYRLTSSFSLDLSPLLDPPEEVSESKQSVFLTVAETKESAQAFGEDCFYAYDAEGRLYRVLWTDFDSLEENGWVVVFYTRSKTLYRLPASGGWVPCREIAASGVRSAKEEPAAEEEPLFRYDRYRISADTREALTDREYDLYCKTVDSILAHDGVVKGFESYEEFEKVKNVLFREFIPLRHLIHTAYTADPYFSYENGTATLLFLADRETCDRRYALFENVMNEALSTIKKGDGDWERLAKLYLYAADHMTYGDPLPEAYWEEQPEVYRERLGDDLYGHIVYRRGVCVEYARFLNLLAWQIGLDAKYAESSEGKPSDHAWSLIRVEGEWYHFDPCWQHGSASFRRMTYFAMSTATRLSTLEYEQGKVKLHTVNDWTYQWEELPECGADMDGGERVILYDWVIDDYKKAMAKAGSPGTRIGEK